MLKAQREHNKKFTKKLRNMKDTNPKLYWNMLQGGKRNKKTSPISIKDFYEHFKQLADNNDNNGNAEEQLKAEDDNSRNELNTISLNARFDEQEIRKCIDKLRNGKSAGIDRIVNEYIKCTADIFMPIYIVLFNKIFDTGTIPEDWVIGLIVPVYKNKGDLADCNNYRGITLLSCMGKLFTSILNARLYKFCEVNNIIKESQTGFRRGYSTVDHIFLMKNIIDLYCSKKKRLFCAFIDYSKAFDTVWRDALWFKLYNAGISGKILNVIKNMYKQIKSCVFTNGSKSEYFVSLTGVRQGENLSPLLFSLYVDDLENYLSERGCAYISCDDITVDRYLRLMVLMYADDTIVMANNKENLQKAIDNMCKYCERWKLKMNSSKTKVTVFGNRKIDASKFSFTCNGEELEIVHNFKYLGIIFNFNGAFKIGITELKKQASRAMFALISKCRKFDLPIDIRLELFDSLVMPVMLYASEVWGGEHTGILEALHLKFLKYTLRVKTSTCNNMVYGELGRFPLVIDIQKRLIGYWARLITGKSTKLSKVMYDCLLHLYSAGIYDSPWLLRIKQILDTCGLSYV